MQKAKLLANKWFLSNLVVVSTLKLTHIGFPANIKVNLLGEQITKIRLFEKVNF